MRTKKQLRKPENWQDFESLCKKLWGEIWRCPEIKKNGRVGQSQFGVDIYGIPHGETSYYGIQCKGKDDYTAANLTESEINSEIEKAKFFLPALRKYYIVTTANKDATIESIVREINIRHINNGQFEVHLFCWEDIVDLIEENPVTYNYYVNSQNFISNYNVLVTFENDETSIDRHVIFNKKITHYIEDKKNIFDTLAIMHQNIVSPNFMPLYGNSQENLSIVKFKLKVVNIGSVPIEKYNIIFSLDGDYDEFEVMSKGHPLIKSNPSYNIKPKFDKLEFIDDSGIIVPNNYKFTDKMYIKPNHETPQTLVLKWELLSTDFSCSGELKINVTPEIREKPMREYVKNGQEPRVETKVVECFAEVEK